MFIFSQIKIHPYYFYATLILGIFYLDNNKPSQSQRTSQFSSRWYGPQRTLILFCNYMERQKICGKRTGSTKLLSALKKLWEWTKCGHSKYLFVFLYEVINKEYLLLVCSV